jgi:hypothetical protein
MKEKIKLTNLPFRLEESYEYCTQISGMRKYMLLLLMPALLLLISCSSTKQVTQQTSVSTEKATGVEFQTLKATNLSEDGTILSSGDDEIFLSVNFFVKEGNIYVNRYNKFYGQWVFNKKSMEHALNERFELKRKMLKEGIMIFTLVELDEYNRENAINEALKVELLEELNGTGGTINEGKIESVLKGNDLLGVKLIRMNEVNTNSNNTEFSGSVALDKYNYTLSWKLF